MKDKEGLEAAYPNVCDAMITKAIDSSLKRFEGTPQLGVDLGSFRDGFRSFVIHGMTLNHSSYAFIEEHFRDRVRRDFAVDSLFAREAWACNIVGFLRLMMICSKQRMLPLRHLYLTFMPRLDADDYKLFIDNLWITPNLETLSITGAYALDGSLSVDELVVPALQKLSALRRLSIGRFFLCGKTLRNVCAAIEKHPSLKCLSISGNVSLREDEVQHVVDLLPKLSELRGVNLYNDTHVQRFIEALPLAQGLQTLGLVTRDPPSEAITRLCQLCTEHRVTVEKEFYS